MKIQFGLVHFSRMRKKFSMQILIILLLTSWALAGEKNLKHKRQTNDCKNGAVPFEYSCDECGTTFSSQTNRIVGGSLTVPNAWPAQVFIVQNIKGDLIVGNTIVYNQTLLRRCGGTLISRYAVLSAAHCIASVNDKLNDTTTYTNSYYSTLQASFDIYIGIHNISFLKTGGEVPSDAIKMSVERIIKYPYYDSTANQNDLAIFILSKPVNLTNNIQLACLPSSSYLNYPYENTPIVAIGWGLLNENDVQLPDILHSVVLSTYAASYCDSIMSAYGVYVNPNNQFCAGLLNNGKDTCYGDSGGGIYTFDAALNKYVLVGITSFGIGCARNNTLGIYTRVNYYNNIFNQWITQNWIPYIPTTTTTTTTTTTITTTTTSTTKQSTTITSSVLTKTTSTVTNPLTTTITTKLGFCSYGQVLYRDICFECGTTATERSARIVGGSIPNKNDWASHVLIIQTIKGDIRVDSTVVYNQIIVNRCGGTLVNLYAILTAASCILDKNDKVNRTTTIINLYGSLESTFEVYVGAFDISFLKNGNKPSDTVKVQVSKVKKYPYYDPDTKNNDIALLILSTSVELTENVKLACLPNSTYLNFPSESVDVVAVGWGLQSENMNTYPDILQYINLKTYSKEECDGYMNIFGIYHNFNNQFCAGLVNGGKDTCTGDYGGGLYAIDFSLNKYILVGITSYGIGCARNNTLSIYTRVNYFNNIFNTWITENWMPEFAVAINPTTLLTVLTDQITTTKLATAASSITSVASTTTTISSSPTNTLTTSQSPTPPSTALTTLTITTMSITETTTINSMTTFSSTTVTIVTTLGNTTSGISEPSVDILNTALNLKPYIFSLILFQYIASHLLIKSCF